VKVGDLVRHQHNVKDTIGIVVKKAPGMSEQPRCRVDWFGVYTVGWWDEADLRVVSESR
jgi:hypothetical protein